MNNDNINYINEIIEYLKKDKYDFFDDHGIRVIVGSFAIGTQTISSDIDILYFYEGEVIEPTRIEKIFFGRRVSICYVSSETVKEDGEIRKYGGYYSIKCLNPSLVIGENKKLRNLILTAAGSFLGPLAYYISLKNGNEYFSGEEVACHCFLAYMGSNLGYNAYFLSYFLSNNFKFIRLELVNKVLISFINSGIIFEDGNGLYKYNKNQDYMNYEIYHFTRLNIHVQWASYGGYVHDDYFFQEKYYKNVLLKLEKMKSYGLTLNTLRNFFHEKTGLDQIII